MTDFFQKRDVVWVVAEHIADYHSWCGHSKPYNARFCYSVDNLRGYRNVDFVITEGGFKRSDIKDVIGTLMLCNIGTKYENKVIALKMWRLLYS